MNLIHSDSNGNDIGVLQDFEFDLAYGESENNFALELALPDHCCENGDIVYMIDESLKDEQGTEYGGIIDSTNIDTKRQTVTYKGRTWHGILAGKIIEPEAGHDYYIAKGNAHSILRKIITNTGLSDLFKVKTGNSPVAVYRYQFPRYIDAYSGINAMLYAFGGKLKLEYDGTYVQLSVVWLTDYSIDDEWDSSQVTFQVEQSKNYTNHLICLGGGDLKKQYVIHLFTDENGGLQDYATVDDPVQDSQYILDKQNMVLTGTREICETRDFSSSGETENYVVLTTQPSDWSEKYTEYYYLDDNDDFKNIEQGENAEYSALTSKPSDWDTKYSNYFDSSHKSVEGIESTTYTQLTKKPSDWEKNWNKYYYYDEDQSAYVPVSYEVNYKYEEQTQQPSDWSTSYASYYQRKVNSEIVYNADGSIAKDGAYIRTRKSGDGYETVPSDGGSAPTWKRGRYFTRKQKQNAPEFDNGVTKYKMKKAVTAPTWTANSFYTRTKKGDVPSFKSGVYYRKVLDHYASLVASGIEALERLNQRVNSVNINLNLDGEYDINDVVGAREETTGVEVWQPIVKKIVNINRNGKSISYKVGDTSQL